MVTIHAPTISAVPTNLGYGALSPMSCVVTEELNGQYDLVLTHPVDATGKWERIVRDRILSVPTYRGTQLFRIYDVDSDAIAGTVTATARHIFYDLARNLVESVSPSGTTGAIAGAQILAGCQYESGFAFDSDITSARSAEYVRVNPVQALMGDGDNSFIRKWGGEIVRDNWDITIDASIGADNGRTIAYAKNLTGLKVKEDTTDTCTRIVPVARDADGEYMLLPEVAVDSSRISDYPLPMIKTVDMSDIRVGEEVGGVILYPDTATAYEEMRARCEALFDAGHDLPKYTLDVNFVNWKDVEEYKAFAWLFDVELGDYVRVRYDPLGVDSKLRVVGIEWDCIKERYLRLRIGDRRASIGTLLSSVGSRLATVEGQISIIGGRINVYVGAEPPTVMQQHDLFVDTDDTSRYDVSPMIATDQTLSYDYETHILGPESAITVTLPATTATIRATGCKGTVMRIRNVGTFPATIAAGAGETIDGAASIAIYPGESVELEVMAVGEWVS